jgi:hypothetical protein
MTILTLHNGVEFDPDIPIVVSTRNSKKGVVLYRGPSVLDGEPIVAIATFNTSNAKTGDMIQTWIMREDVSPQQAVDEGKDSSVCGKCPHRHYLGGGCYVLPFQAPRSVWSHYKAGGYQPKVVPSMFNDRRLRIGSYGDPAAVPYEVWQELLLYSDGHTGYTHQLRHPNFDERIADICMISADTEKASLRIQAKGHNTFRIVTDLQSKRENEVQCLSTSHGITCSSCGLCSGSSGHNIVIVAHGVRSNRVKD